jgi:hypothetical protein
MQMKMLVRRNVIELEAGRAEGLELGAHLRQHLPTNMGQKKHRCAGAHHIRSEAPALIDEIRDGRGGQNRLCVDQREMQPDREPWQPVRQFDGRRGRRRSNHQARRGENTLDMRALDGLVDFIGEAEIIRRDDQIFQCAVSCRSRRKRKNSAPSRRRRFITSGLLTISPRIEAILPGRK